MKVISHDAFETASILSVKGPLTSALKLLQSWCCPPLFCCRLYCRFCCRVCRCLCCCFAPFRFYFDVFWSQLLFAAVFGQIAVVVLLGLRAQQRMRRIFLPPHNTTSGEKIFLCLNTATRSLGQGGSQSAGRNKSSNTT